MNNLIPFFGSQVPKKIQELIMRYHAGLWTAVLSPPELRAAMRARLEAVWRKDAVTWNRLTADEFTVVVPEGKLQTKAERLAALKTEKPQAVHAVQHDETHVYGNTAVHRFVDNGEWILEVWVLKNSKWRVVAAQVNFENNDQ